MWRIPAVALVVTLATGAGAGAGPALAHVPAAPPWLNPDGAGHLYWYGEAPTGVHEYSQGRWTFGRDPLTTLPGARIMLHTHSGRPDGQPGSAYLWFNTRAGSTFHVTSCDAEGVERTQRVARKDFQALVRRTHERTVRVDYDKRANAGDFALTTPCVPDPPIGNASDEPDRPDWLSAEDFREGATGTYWSDWETWSGFLDERWVVVDRRNDLPGGRWEWFDTGVPGSTFELDFCTPAGNRFFRPVSRLEFMQRSGWHYFQLTISYDAERNTGHFRGDIHHDAGEVDDDCDAPVRERE